MRTSANGIQKITSYEGFRSCPYDLRDGVITQGFGSTAGIKMGDKCWSRTQALLRFTRDLALYESALNRKIKEYALKLTQNQYDAFVSFIYNLGTGMLEKGHDFGRWLSQGKVGKAIDSMIEYVDPGTKFEAGLTTRRKAEMALARLADKPVLTPEERQIATWQARLLRVRADVRKLGHWTPGRKKLADELKRDIKNHTVHPAHA